MATSTQPARQDEHLTLTARDGSQMTRSRACRYGSMPYAPLSWWRACGFTAEEKSQWAKIVAHPEHARMLVEIGFAPENLRGFSLGPVRLGTALKWLNPYREATRRMPHSWAEFERLLAALKRCGAGIENVEPFAAANYALAIADTGLTAEMYAFAASQPAWVEAICRHVTRPGAVAASMVRTLMRVGAGPEILGVLATGRQNLYWFDAVDRAAREIFMAGEFAAEEDCYRAVLHLAEMTSAAPGAEDTIVRLFLSGGDRVRLYSAVVVDRIHDAVRLEGIFEENVATALVGGFL